MLGGRLVDQVAARKQSTGDDNARAAPSNASERHQLRGELLESLGILNVPRIIITARSVFVSPRYLRIKLASVTWRISSLKLDTRDDYTFKKRLINQWIAHRLMARHIGKVNEALCVVWRVRSLDERHLSRRHYTARTSPRAPRRPIQARGTRVN